MKLNSIPESITIDTLLTRKCQLQCRYCYVAKDKNVMNKSIFKKIINFLAESDFKEKKLIILGGEPLLAFTTLKYGLRYLNLQKKTNLSVGLNTNGLSFTKGTKNILKYLDFISISIDGPKKIHLLNRKRCNYEVIIKNTYKLKRLTKKSGILFGITLTLNNKTVNHFVNSVKYIIRKFSPDILDFQLTLGDKNWNNKSLKLLDTRLNELAQYASYFFSSEKSASYNPFKHFITKQFRNLSIAADTDGYLYPCSFCAGIKKYLSKNYSICHINELNKNRIELFINNKTLFCKNICTKFDLENKSIIATGLSKEIFKKKEIFRRKLSKEINLSKLRN